MARTNAETDVNKNTHKDEREIKKSVVIAKLFDYLQFREIFRDCPRLEELQVEQEEKSLPFAMWQNVMLLLTGRGFVAHAKRFSRSSEKHDSASERFIDEISLGRDVDESIRCRELGCGEKRIKKCLEKCLDNFPAEKRDKIDVDSFSPAPYILKLTHDDKRKLGWIYKVDDKTGEEYFDGISFNIFTRYILLNYDIALHKSEGYYLYQYNVWKEVTRNTLKRILRRFFLKYEPAYWQPGIEGVYMSTLGYDCWELSELKVEEASKFINVRNGLLDIDTFKIVPHDKMIFSTTQVAVEYDDSAEYLDKDGYFLFKKWCPAFGDFLQDIFAEDWELIDYMQEVLGYCLSSVTLAHKMWIFLGGGSNGKSVLCDVLIALVGGVDNVSNVSLDSFQRNFAMSQIVDKTVNISTENELKGRLNTHNLKAIVGGDVLQFEKKYEHPVSYRPTAKLLFSVNKMPNIKDTTYGFERRVDIVPFNVRFVRKPDKNNPYEKRLDPYIKEKLLKELPGIFAFAIEGFKRLKKRRFKFPKCAAVEEQREILKRSIDDYLDFMKECVNVEPPDNRTSITKTEKKGTRTLVTAKSGETMVRSNDLHFAFVGWYSERNDTKSVSAKIGIFLSELRRVLKDHYRFGNQEGHPNLCNNEEERAGRKTHFHCLSLNEKGLEYMGAGQSLLEKSEARTARIKKEHKQETE
jgi:putative DNA primase/helicase